MELFKSSKDDFLRKVFIQIHNDKKSPLDLLAMSFGEVEEREEQFYYITQKIVGFTCNTYGEYEQQVQKGTKSAYVHAGDLYTYDGEQYYADTSGYKEIDAVEVVDVLKETKTYTEAHTEEICTCMTRELKTAPYNLNTLFTNESTASRFEMIDCNKVFSQGEIDLMCEGLSKIFLEKHKNAVIQSSDQIQVYKVTLPIYQVSYQYREHFKTITGLAFDPIPAVIDYSTWDPWYEIPTEEKHIPDVFGAFFEHTYKRASFSDSERSFIYQNKEFFAKHARTVLLIDKIKQYGLKEISLVEKENMPFWPAYIKTEQDKCLDRKYLADLTDEEYLSVKNRPKYLESYTKTQKKIITKFLKLFDRMIAVHDLERHICISYDQWIKIKAKRNGGNLKSHHHAPASMKIDWSFPKYCVNCLIAGTIVAIIGLIMALWGNAEYYRGYELYINGWADWNMTPAEDVMATGMTTKIIGLVILFIGSSLTILPYFIKMILEYRKRKSNLK